MTHQSTNLRPVCSLWVAGLLMLLALLGGVQLPALASDCGNVSTGLVPLNDLGAATYGGYEGGLYPGGSNEPPEAYLVAGQEAAAGVIPRAPDGSASNDGLIGLVGVGVSNTKIEFAAFQSLAATSSGLNPSLVIVNGAQGSRALDQWAEGPNANPWRNLDVDVRRSGLTPAQVQVVWIKLPDKSRGTVDLERDAPLEIERLTSVLEILADRYPNLRLAYLSSRIYAGYSEGSEAEPKAYQSGFTIKWLIEQQIEQAADLAEGRRPWVGWGPYLWADGTTARSDGLSYVCGDMDADGIHPGSGAAEKVASLLLSHLTTDQTATSWFLGSTESPTPPSTTTTEAPVTTTTTGQVETTTTEAPSNTSGSSLPSTPPPTAAPRADDGVGTRSTAEVVAVGVGAFLLAFLGFLALTRARSGRRPG